MGLCSRCPCSASCLGRFGSRAGKGDWISLLTVLPDLFWVQNSVLQHIKAQRVRRCEATSADALLHQTPPETAEAQETSQVLGLSAQSRTRVAQGWDIPTRWDVAVSGQG